MTCTFRISLLVYFLCAVAQESISICTSGDNATCSSNATFSKDYVAVRVDFDSEIKPLVANNYCSSILEAATLTILGSNPICAFQSTRSLEIFPDKDGTIKPGSTLAFKDGSIRDHLNRTINITSISVQRFSESGASQPIVVLTEDGYQSSCPTDKRYASGDYSRNSGYAHFRYIWALDTMVDNMSDSQVIAANSALQNRAKNESEIEITTTIAAANSSISLNIMNVFGESSNATLDVTNHANPTARILGKRRLTVFSNNELCLLADLAVTKCGSAVKKMTYLWNISKTETTGDYNIGDFMNENKAFNIKPNMLPGGSRSNISVTISYILNNNQSGMSTDFIVVDVKRPKLVADIMGGDRYIGMNQKLVLKAKPQLNPRESVSYQWSCKHAVSGEICKKKNGTSSMDFANTSTVIVNMQDGNFASGNKYQFILTTTRGVEAASSSIVVTVKPSKVPIVTVISDRDNWSYDEKIFIRGVIFGSYASITYKWSIHDLFGDEIKALSQSGNSQSDLTSGIMTRNIMMKILKKALSKEQTYIITLEVTAGSSIGRGSLLQRVTMPPRYGYLSLTPPQGIAYNTTFRIRSHGWIDRWNRQPFQYRFGYIDSNNNKQKYLTAWRNYNVAPRVFLTNGNSSNRLTVFAEVRNSLGLLTRREAVTEVSNEQRNQRALTKYFNEMLIAGEYDLLSEAFIELFKSGINKEGKSGYLNDYLGAIEKSSFSCDHGFIFINALQEICVLDAESSRTNASNAVLNTVMKGKIASIVAKVYTHLDFKKDGVKITETQAEQLSDIIICIIPKPQSLSASDSSMLNDFKTASNKFGTLTCKSAQYNGKPLKIDNTVVAVTSEYIDLTSSIPTSLISPSMSYRQRYFQTLCSESNYMNCVGLCASVTSFKDQKYFMLEGAINGLVTDVHEARVKDMYNGKDVVFAASGYEFEFNLPVVKAYNKTTFALQCLMQDQQTKKWVSSLCNSNTVTSSSGKDILHCKCSKLHAVVGATVLKASLSSTAKPTNASTSNLSSKTTTTVTHTPTTKPATTLSPADIVTIYLHANCTKYLRNDTKHNFTESLRSSLAKTLKIKPVRIRILAVACGSIIVNVTIGEKAGSSPDITKSSATNNLKALLSSGLLRVTLYDGIVPAVAPGVNVSFPPTPPPVTKKKIVIPDFKTNWMPLFVSLVLLLITIVALSAFVAWLHGRYYKKKQYTDINCNRKKPVTKEVLNKKQKMRKFEGIIEDSLADHQSSLATGSTVSIIKKGPRKSRVGAIASLAVPTTQNVMMNRNMFSADKRVRELPRLALDESSSESEVETSFSNANSSVNREQSKHENTVVNSARSGSDVR